MTDDEEFAARWQFKWQRAGSDWILLYHRRRMGRVVPDPAKPGMYRSLKSGDFSDISNLSWAKDAVLAQAIREVAWNAANYPQKCPVKRGSREQKSPPIRLNAA
jgi:hypothetical protein